MDRQESERIRDIFNKFDLQLVTLGLIPVTVGYFENDDTYTRMDYLIHAAESVKLSSLAMRLTVNFLGESLHSRWINHDCLSWYITVDEKTNKLRLHIFNFVNNPLLEKHLTVLAEYLRIGITISKLLILGEPLNSSFYAIDIIFANYPDYNVMQYHYTLWLQQVIQYRLYQKTQYCKKNYADGLCCVKHIELLTIRRMFHQWFLYFIIQPKMRTANKYLDVFPERDTLLGWVKDATVLFNDVRQYLEYVNAFQYAVTANSLVLPTKVCMHNRQPFCCDLHLAILAIDQIISAWAESYDRQYNISLIPAVEQRSRPSLLSEDWKILLEYFDGTRFTKTENYEQILEKYGIMFN